MAFVTARLAEAWSAARDRELTAGLDGSPETRMIDALRAVVEAYEKSVRMVGEGLSVSYRRLVQAVAAIWSDHPDYRAEWKP